MALEVDVRWQRTVIGRCTLLCYHNVNNMADIFFTKLEISCIGSKTRLAELCMA